MLERRLERCEIRVNDKFVNGNNSRLSTVQMLIRSGADVSMRNESGHTPLDYARFASCAANLGLLTQAASHASLGAKLSSSAR